MKKWQIKALVQQIISHIPYGESLNYILQRYVSRTIVRNESSLRSSLTSTRLHLDALAQLSSRPLADSTFYEFGAGWDLKGPLAFWCWGVDHQICIDISRHIRWELVNDVIKHLRKIEDVGFCRLPEHPVHSEADLRCYYGIDYQAPCDARKTGLPDQSVNVITTTFTLEHIPPADIAAIFRESHRILKNDGVMSHLIDYQDHYSYFDSSVNRYNFFRYSERAWKLYNSSIHYQSRQRHKDYLKLLEDAGFKTLLDTPRCTEKNLNELKQIPIHAEFEQKYTFEELAVRSAHIVSCRR